MKGVRTKMVKKSKINIGDFVEIIDPGNNMPTAWKSAQIMKSKWYKGISIRNRPSIYNKIWYIVDKYSDENRRPKDYYLLRNDELQMDLIFSSGIRVIKDEMGMNSILKDENFFI